MAGDLLSFGWQSAGTVVAGILSVVATAVAGWLARRQKALEAQVDRALDLRRRVQDEEVAAVMEFDVFVQECSADFTRQYRLFREVSKVRDVPREPLLEREHQAERFRARLEVHVISDDAFRRVCVVTAGVISDTFDRLADFCTYCDHLFEVDGFDELNKQYRYHWTPAKEAWHKAYREWRSAHAQNGSSLIISRQTSSSHGSSSSGSAQTAT